MIAFNGLKVVSVSNTMPRNDQVTRQWHLLRLLESSRGVTLDEIITRLPADYPHHGRTVRRDLEALEAAGFPLLNERIEGRVRWRLMDGVRQAPALTFSPTELMALMISRSLLKPLAGTEIQSALESAMAKASRLLPSASIDYVQQMQNVFAVGLGPHKTYRVHRETIRPSDASHCQKAHGADAILLCLAPADDPARSRSLSAVVCLRRPLSGWLLPLAQGAAHVCRRANESRLMLEDEKLDFSQRVT